MNPASTNWLQPLLADNLRPASAPEALWDRLWRPRTELSRWKSVTRQSFAVGSTVFVAAALLLTGAASRPGQSFRSADPGEIRRWVKNCSGIDVPLAAALPLSLELVEARSSRPGSAEIVFQVEGREAVLTVAGVPTKAAIGHSQGERIWQARGVGYSMEPAARLDAACPLCHAAL